MVHRPLRAVAFDIGGVVAADYWETIYFSWPVGIVATLKLQAEKLECLGAQLAQKYCLLDAKEADYWDDFERNVGCRPTAHQLMEAGRAVWVDRSFGETVTALRERGLRVFVVTDNTSFWSQTLFKRLGIDKILPDDNILASWKLGIRKKSLPFGTYRVLRRLVDPARTLVIDDRASNLAAAARDGFSTMRYQGFAGSQIVDWLSFLL
jgi:FMN phosphatase YigB (HAD superfamily)